MEGSKALYDGPSSLGRVTSPRQTVASVTRDDPTRQTTTSDTHYSIDYDAHYKMVLIGNSGVGKTSLCYSLAGKPGNNTIATTGVDMLRKPYHIDGLNVMLQLWDTCGMEKCAPVIKASFHRAKGVVLVYAVNDRASFADIETRWRRDMEDILPPSLKIPVFLIANKTDLPMEEHVVSKKEGQQLAASLTGWTFHEACAINAPQTEQLFVDLITAALKADGFLTVERKQQSSVAKKPSDIIDLSSGRDIGAVTSTGGTTVKANQEQTTNCYC